MNHRGLLKPLNNLWSLVLFWIGTREGRADRIGEMVDISLKDQFIRFASMEDPALRFALGRWRDSRDSVRYDGHLLVVRKLSHLLEIPSHMPFFLVLPQDFSGTWRKTLWPFSSALLWRDS